VYEAYVREQERNLGADNPLFLSQYCLRTLPRAGRLFGSTQLGLLQGSYKRLDAPLPGETYVAGLDLAGEASDAGVAGHDSTVLTVARLRPAADAEAGPAIEVVRHYEWTGTTHTSLYGALCSLLRDTWRVQRLAVDATGIGEPVASFLKRALGESRVDAVKLTAESKSRLGYGVLAAVNTGRCRLYDDSASVERRECLQQLSLCRATYRANQVLAFAVDPSEGHDDYVVSLALAAAAAAGAGGPRRARGRPDADDFD
jgi:hypothetical protein